MIKKLILLFILLLSLNAKEFDKINLQLDWLHQFQFAGYYVAKEKGYYTEKKLLVNINEFKFGLDLVDNVLRNKNTYSAGKSSLIIDILNGKDLHLLTAIYQHSPMVLVSLKKSNINNISDLVAKRVMLTHDAVSAASINSMIKSSGTNLDKINFIPHSFKLEDLINGKTEAMGSYLSNEPYLLDQKNIEYKIFNPKDYGFDFYGGLLFTSQDEIKKNPTRVKNFYDATIKGWEYAFSNVEETAKLIYEKYNSQNKSLDSLIYEGKVLKELSGFNDGSFSNLNIKRINEIKRLYLLLGLSKESNVDLKEHIFNKTSILLNNEEKKLLNDIKIDLDFKKSEPYFYNEKKGLTVDVWNKLNLNIQENEKNKQISLHYTINKNSIDKSRYTLSEPLISIPAVLVTKINKNYINSLELLSNEKIAINKNSDFIIEVKKKYPNIKFIEVKNTSEAYELLSNDEVFGMITDSISFPHLSKLNYKDIKISSYLSFKYDLFYYTKIENQTLINIINKLAHENIRSEDILNKYQVVLYKGKTDYSWVYKFLIPLLLILGYILLTNARLRKEIIKRENAEKNLLYALNHDSLTKVNNRSKIESKIDNEIEKAKRFNNTFSVIFFDIDDFKKINDNFGHMFGDKVLIKVAKVVKNNIRKIDAIGRWGGEEFIIVLPQTDASQAYNLADKIRKLLEQDDFGIHKNLTASFGVSEYKNSDTRDDIVLRADDAMYLAKRKSKNSVVIN